MDRHSTAAVKFPPCVYVLSVSGVSLLLYV